MSHRKSQHKARILGGFVDTVAPQSPINKRAGVGRGAAALKSVNFHLNIKSSSLKSADGVDFIARALLRLPRMSHSLHRL